MKTTRVLWCLILLLGVVGSVQAESVDALVAKKASILKKMHSKAKKALVNAAQDKSFAQYYSVHDAQEKHAVKGRIENVSLNVQKRFHVEEMCLIDARGPEVARIVGNQIAPSSDLSPDESGAVFFQPAFEQRPLTSYISPIYLSPDADKLVLAYVTPIVVGEDKKAILHYEHGLDVYQAALQKKLPAGTIFLAVTQEGLVLFDNRREIPVEKRGNAEELAAYLSPLNFEGQDLAALRKAIDATGKVGGYQGAYRKVEDWTLIALQK